LDHVVPAEKGGKVIFPLSVHQFTKQKSRYFRFRGRFLGLPNQDLVVIAFQDQRPQRPVVDVMS
jgi:hypothetical protein